MSATTAAGFSASADRANLYGITKAVEWEGYQASGGAWSQAGVAFTDEVKAALVPGSVIDRVPVNNRKYVDSNE